MGNSSHIHCRRLVLSFACPAQGTVLAGTRGRRQSPISHCRAGADGVCKIGLAREAYDCPGGGQIVGQRGIAA